MYKKIIKFFTSDWFLIILFWVSMFLVFLYYTPTTHAQSIVLRGNTFICVDSVESKHPTMTKYFYLDKKGNKFPIYMTANGKCFIIKTSKRTGKPYRKNMPEITKALYGRSVKASK